MRARLVMRRVSVSLCIAAAMALLPAATGTLTAQQQQQQRQQQQQGQQQPQGQRQQPAANNTPRAADGHPDLSGVWGGGGGGGGDAAAQDPEKTVALLRARAPEVDKTVGIGADKNYAYAIVNFERDSGIMQRMDPNRPLYKPEYWQKVRDLDYDGNAQDPAFRCLPEGVPRMGPPDKIVQTPSEMIFLYGTRMTRIIYTDGRPIPPVSEWIGLWNGRSYGHWEGDTLVIETVDFNDETWLAWPGWIHSIDMKVTERIRREGNNLNWQATVEDPMLLKPWTTNPRTVRLNPNPKAELEEDLPCFERDLPNMVTKERG